MFIPDGIDKKENNGGLMEAMMGEQTLENSAIRFLEQDFNQAFEQLRHYDKQMLSLSQFITTVYTGIIALAIGCYKLSLDKGVDLSWACAGLLAPATLFGFLFLANILRIRVYYTQTARYLNEHRAFFLGQKPLGFENKTGMYTNYNRPRYFKPKSSQSFFIYLSCLFNSLLLCLLFYFLFEKVQHIRLILIGVGLVSFFVQLGISVDYLQSYEKNQPQKRKEGKS